MNSFARFTKCIFQWERSLLKFVGHDILAEYFIRNSRSYLVYIVLSSTLVAGIHSILNYGKMSIIFFLFASTMGFQVLHL